MLAIVGFGTYSYWRSYGGEFIWGPWQSYGSCDFISVHLFIGAVLVS